jgi:hypothetical protein
LGLVRLADAEPPLRPVQPAVALLGAVQVVLALAGVPGVAVDVLAGVARLALAGRLAILGAGIVTILVTVGRDLAVGRALILVVLVVAAVAPVTVAPATVAPVVPAAIGAAAGDPEAIGAVVRRAVAAVVADLK